MNVRFVTFLVLDNFKASRISQMFYFAKTCHWLNMFSKMETKYSCFTALETLRYKLKMKHGNCFCFKIFENKFSLSWYLTGPHYTSKRLLSSRVCLFKTGVPSYITTSLTSARLNGHRRCVYIRELHSKSSCQYLDWQAMKLHTYRGVSTSDTVLLDLTNIQTLHFLGGSRF